jgi:hypothetical protein
MGLARKNELPCCDSGPQATVPIRQVFLTRPLAAKASTAVVARDVLRKKDRRRELEYSYGLPASPYTNLGEPRATELAMRKPRFDPHLLHQSRRDVLLARCGLKRRRASIAAEGWKAG